MVSNRLSQEHHPINLVGFLPQHIQEDLRLAMAGEEGDTAIFVDLAEELMEEDCGPFTDPLVVASIVNYDGYLSKKVQFKRSVAGCCKEELCNEGTVTIDHPGSESSAKFTAVHLGWVQRSHGAQDIIWDDCLGPTDVLRREQG